MSASENMQERSLDPGSWEAMRELGHRMVDDVIEHMSTIGERPPWKPIPEGLREKFQEPVPTSGVGGEQAYEDFRELVLPYPYGNAHPRFWGWVAGSGTVLGAFADLLAGSLDMVVSGGQTSAVLVEEQVLRWFKSLMGFPEDASGILTGGGSEANLIGMLAGLHAKAGFDVGKCGLSSSPKEMVVYASTETHFSVERAVRLMGLGANSYRRISVDSNGCIDLTELEQTIHADRNEGRLPLIVVGNAGATNTGAFDNLQALAELSERENLWYHIDGAFGALASLLPDYRDVVAGMDRADSLTFDFHKWLHVPYDAGCVLIRRKEDHERPFPVVASYFAAVPRGAAVDTAHFARLGIQQSRGFRALKVWMSIKEHGIDRFGEIVDRNIRQARYLAQLVEESDELQLMAPVPLNVVCFRFAQPGLSDDTANALNRELLMQLHERGIAVPSPTTIDGSFVIRCSITNHRTRFEDIRILVESVIEIGREIGARTS